MHPALSILVFTTASGAGYGLLFLLALGGPAGLIPAERGLGLWSLGLAVGLICLGLLASTLHLKHPERARLALSQWRSSWLSREGVAALATFAPTALYALGWIGFADNTGLWGYFGLLTALGAVVTVVCTGNIYASLKTVRQWHSPWVVPVYLALSLATGALWLSALLLLFAAPAAWALGAAVLALVVAWALKFGYWQAQLAPSSGPDFGTANDLGTATDFGTANDLGTATNLGAATDLGTATGLGGLGRVRPLDPPHTEENYLLKEMGYRVGRKHADKLRRIAMLLGALVPIVLILPAALIGGPFGGIVALLAALAGLAGTLVERWLFFAEATHTVALYYGRGDAAPRQN